MVLTDVRRPRGAALSTRLAPRVVAIVLNWCGEADTHACLRSVLASDYPELVVLLVDNGSPDGSGERLHARWPEVPYLQTGANLGYTGGNNRGFAWARAERADYVLVLNNDTEIDPSCVSLLVDVADSDASVGGVAPKILRHDTPNRLWYAGGSLALSRGTGQHAGEGALDTSDGAGGISAITFMTGCCFLLSRRALDEIGGFEESFFAYNEDVDLSWRLLRAGFRLVYEPRARLTHKVPPPSALPSAFQIRQRDRNRRRFVALRLGLLARLRFAGWFYPTRVCLLLRFAAVGDWPRAGAIWAGMR